MSEMIERIARALALSDYPGSDWDASFTHDEQRAYRRRARAAFETMREPIEALREEYAHVEEVAQVFAAIDALRSEKQPT